MSEQIDLIKFDSEDFKYVLHLIPQETLEAIATGLRDEVAELTKKQKSLNILDAFFKDKAKQKEDGNTKLRESDKDLPPESITASSEGDLQEGVEPSSLPEATQYTKNADSIPSTPEKPKKTLKNRGTIEERYSYLKNLFEEEDNWIYVLELERRFLKTEWVDEEDNVKEVVRGFLRQATEKNQLIFETVFRINTDTNKVETARMYGLPSFYEVDRDFNMLKLEEKVGQLGLFMTLDEGTKARNAKTHGVQLGIDSQ
ncbi:hypothetical protein GO730_14450 [Spirosoma sp. HMF3257]|uniref:Uncharacterized protein n=1 Tax=Spirosoma telluris TaxID=2183553 RepID=A0A327NIB5_9BACT|nr:hypothetical protein [Spirosoma telluris]RAI75091.1 hypothetical protein HMF3257_14380 [Spirosoma telluris]